MASLQKFKNLATRCAVTSSPTRSPAASPVIHLRRRKTLRMLLGRGGTSIRGSGSRRFARKVVQSPDDHNRPDRSSSKPEEEEQEQEDADLRKRRHHRRKLKDLFISSPPPPPYAALSNPNAANKQVKEAAEGGESPPSKTTGWRAVVDVERINICSGMVVARRIGVRVGVEAVPGPIRPLSAALRQRLLRRAWRPVLVSIPEQSP